MSACSPACSPRSSATWRSRCCAAPAAPPRAPTPDEASPATDEPDTPTTPTRTLARSTPTPARSGSARPALHGLPLAATASVGAGVASALLGIGGGLVKVPVMHLVLGVPLLISTATSNLRSGSPHRRARSSTCSAAASTPTPPARRRSASSSAPASCRGSGTASTCPTAAVCSSPCSSTRRSRWPAGPWPSDGLGGVPHRAAPPPASRSRWRTSCSLGRTPRSRSSRSERSCCSPVAALRPRADRPSTSRRCRRTACASARRLPVARDPRRARDAGAPRAGAPCSIRAPRGTADGDRVGSRSGRHRGRRHRRRHVTLRDRMDLLILLASFVIILAGAELFTNGIEWFGRNSGSPRAPSDPCSRPSARRSPRR